MVNGFEGVVKRGVDSLFLFIGQLKTENIVKVVITLFIFLQLLVNTLNLLFNQLYFLTLKHFNIIRNNVRYVEVEKLLNQLKN